MRFLLILSLLAGVPSDLGPVPGPIRERLRLAPRYTMYLDAEGLPIVSAESVSPYALREAAWITIRMLESRPDLRTTLIARNTRIAVLGVDERITELPEYAWLRPRVHWDTRARGLGGTRLIPCAVAPEENLLGSPGDGQSGSSALVHELAHTIHAVGLDREFDRELRSAYDAAMEKGLWKGTYSARNRREYWAVGVQCHFDAARTDPPQPEGVGTREGLARYDPALAALVRKVFGANDWRWTPPRARAGEGHLEGFDPEKAPRFELPADLVHELQGLETGRTPLPRLPLADLGRRRSSKPSAGTPAASILFRNRTGEPVRIHWVGFDGERRFVREIPPGDHHLLGSFTGYLWLVTDAAEEPLALVEASADPTIVRIDD